MSELYLSLPFDAFKSDELHKKLSEQEILQWFQTLRSSVFFLNSMLESEVKVSNVFAEQQREINRLKWLNHELVAQKHAMELQNWADKEGWDDELAFSSNFKI